MREIFKNLGEKKYVTKAHKAGLQVWVMLDDINISTDGLQVFGTTSHRKTLITAVIDAVKELGADGINLDVETIKSDVGPSYIQFIRELSAACRKEKLVLSVDNYSPMPHTAFYDRTQQGQVVDYVVVMAYDEALCKRTRSRKHIFSCICKAVGRAYYSRGTKGKGDCRSSILQQTVV